MRRNRVSRERKRTLEQPDEFITVSSRMLNYVVENPMKVGLAFAAVILAAAIVVGMRYASVRKEENAFTLLNNAVHAYETEKGEADAVKAYEKVKGEFETLVTDYGSKHSGRIARVVYADIAYQAGKTDKAITLYEKALPGFQKDAHMKALILNGLGYAYEQKNDPEKAVGYFRQVAEAETGMLRDNAKYNMGRLYTKMGKKDEGEKFFQELAQKEGEFIYKDMVKSQING